jgi:hypothetical protein
MDKGRARGIEAAVDAGAALLLAIAVAIVLVEFGAGAALGTALPALAFAGCFYGLRSIQPEAPRFRLAPFESPAEPQAELLLTELDRLHPDELLLDRALAHVGRDSRVVRLFAPAAAVPTPGELKARIDRHLASAPQARSTDPADASEALFSALADLRRSLR